jgi:hypothetical protein
MGEKQLERLGRVNVDLLSHLIAREKHTALGRGRNLRSAMHRFFLRYFGWNCLRLRQPISTTRNSKVSQCEDVRRHFMHEAMVFKVHASPVFFELIGVPMKEIRIYQIRS